jgi:hypothetical protein
MRYLEEALALADEIEDAHTGYLIERALTPPDSGHGTSLWFVFELF